MSPNSISPCRRRDRRATSGSRARAGRGLDARAPKKPMSATWCCPQLFVQPEMLIRTPPIVGQPGVLEGPADVVGQAPALGHGQVAGVGARAGDHVAGQLGAGLGHAEVGEPAVQVGQLGLGEATEHQVLTVGDPHVGAEVAVDRGEAPELVGGDVAQLGVARRRETVPLGHADAPRWPTPTPVRVAAARSTERDGLPTGVGSSRAMPAGASPCSATGGDAARPGRRRRAGTGAPCTIRAAAPRRRAVSTSHFMRARSLLSRLPKWSKDAQDGLDGRQQLLAGGELLEGLRGVRVGAESAGEEHPEAGLDGAVRAGAVHRDDADVVEHRLPAVGGAPREVDLELAGQALGERVAQELVGTSPRAHGLMSSTS